jgi:hypothetical protein
MTAAQARSHLTVERVVKTRILGYRVLPEGDGFRWCVLGKGDEELASGFAKSSTAARVAALQVCIRIVERNEAR